jgi:hypothetical protein
MLRAPRAAALACALVFAGSGCDFYYPPPEPTIVGEEDGLLSDPAAPLVIRFSEPIDPSTLRISVARYVTDSEGNLADEDDDPATELQPYVQHDEYGDLGGSFVLDAAHRTLTITPDAPLPVGPRLVLLVAPGLADAAGHATHARRRLLFGYAFDLECGKPETTLVSGTYFFLANVTSPIPTQVQLFAKLEIDPATGAVNGRFTNADRNPDTSRCGSLACKSTEACRLVPTPACVLPSEKASSTDEFSDYVPNGGPPIGYSFADTGCVQDQPDGSAVLVMAPVDVEVTSPPVTLRNVHLLGAFAPDAKGTLRATGSFSADAVLLGTTPSGAGKGDLTARQIPDDEAPPGIPGPDKAP